jgi:hypothetical protein
MTEWSSRDVQRDPQGFLEAQRKEREQADAAREKQRERDELERFTREFVAAGGDPGSAEKEWQRTRNERAAESAKAKEEATQREMRERRSRVV